MAMGIFSQFYMMPAHFGFWSMCCCQGSKPSEEAPLGMGATLEIQRQQRMDLLDQQMLLAHYSEARRNPRHQPQVHGPCAPSLMNKSNKPRLKTFPICAAWLFTLDQIIPLPEAQRTQSPAGTTPPPGPDTCVHTAPTVGQLCDCRRAGILHSHSLFSWYCFA